MKKTLLFAAALCGMTSFAVEAPTPAAVWNGDFSTTTKGVYTLSANGNTIASDGSTITISANNGVTFARSSALANTVGMTVIYKFDNLVVGSTVKTIGTSSSNSFTDRVGVDVQTSGQTSGIWYDNLNSILKTHDTNAKQTTILSIASDGQFALVYGPSVSNNDGTRLYLKNGSADYTLAYSCGGLKGSSDTVQAMTVGGTRNNGTSFPAASGMVIKAVALFDQALTKDQIAAYSFPEPTPKVEPIALMNFGYTTEETGWYNYHQHGGSILGPVTTNGVSFCATKDVGNFYYTIHDDFGEVNTDFEGNGTYTDIFGTNHVTVQEEIKTSLGLSDVDFTTAVYKSGQMNGGQTDHAVSISGLDATAKYVVYAGFGMLRTQYNEQVMGVQFDASGYATVEALEYIVTVAGTGTTKESRYQPFSAGTQICPGTHGLMLTRLVNVQPKADGAIALTFKGAKGGINFLAVAKVNESKPTSKTFDISGSVSYADLETEGLTSVTLNLTADATVTFTKAVSANLTFTGAYNLTVKGGQHLTWANITDSGVTGTRTYEISGSYTAADGLKNKIKAASTKYKFVFTGNATVDFSSANLGTINTHLVFRGDSSTIKITNGNNKFAAGATYENPTILVERGTLTFYGHDVTGWAAGTDGNGIIRVKNGATLKLENLGTGTFYYNQRIAIDAGATVEVGSSLNGNQFRMTEGVNGQQIWVQDCDTDMSPAKLILSSGVLALAKDGSAQGIGVYVGKNAKLQITGTINSMNNAQNQAVDNTFARLIKKTGAGVLEVSGTHGVTYEVAGGSIGGDATVQKVNLASGTSLVLKDNKALKVQTVLTLPKPINLVCEPVHGMTVITPPSEMEGYTATINGSEKTYELFMDGGALKLKYKTPPEFTEELGTITAIVADGKGGTVEVDISKLNLGDYSDSVSYSLKFGDVVVENPEVVEGKVSFSLNPETFKPNTVYRGEFIVDFGDGTISNEINVYQGERQFVMMDEAIVIKEATTISAADGCMIKPVYENADYIDTCDSIYSVTLSASEAVEVSADFALKGDEQGGLRLIKVDDTTVKLEYVYDDNGTLKWGDQWPNGTGTMTVTRGLNESITVRVEFHYSKGGEDDISYVKYSIGENYEKSVTSWATAKKVTEIFISDGTILGTDNLAGILGQFQLDKAVIFDVEVEIGHGDTQEITAADEKAAQEIADKMVIAIASEVAEKLTAEQKAAYQGYFKVKVTDIGGGKFTASVVFAADVEKAIKEDLEDAIEEVAAGIETGSAEIAAKPGLYYGVKRGDSLNAMSVKDDLILATGETVEIKVEKPSDSSSHFYRIIVSPTPAAK